MVFVPAPALVPKSLSFFEAILTCRQFHFQDIDIGENLPKVGAYPEQRVLLSGPRSMTASFILQPVLGFASLYTDSPVLVEKKVKCGFVLAESDKLRPKASIPGAGYSLVQFSNQSGNMVLSRICFSKRLGRF